MIRGLYTGASGMIAETVRTDATANNLANVNTAGYKKDVAVNTEFGEMLLYRVNDGNNTQAVGSLGRGTQIDEIATIQAQGATRQTGNDFDLAIEGPGFFAVETPAGVRYTRNGTFAKNVVGDLVTQDGNRVLGQNGPVRINGNTMTVTETGQILVDDLPADQLQLVGFADEQQLTKEGSSLYAAAPDLQPQPAAGRVLQGHIEGANVNVVAEMVNLINSYRTYEANAKTVQSQDQILDKAVNEVGRV